MPFAANGEVRLYYEMIGDPSKPAVLLLNGAGRQSIDFPDRFCAAMAGRGFAVVRFDQRDTGLSTSFADQAPDAAGAAAAVAAGRTPRVAYGVEALVADAVAVLDAAGVARAHLFGRSLGSLVAQLLALEHPGRALSLTLAIAFSRGIGETMAQARLSQLDAEHFEDAEQFATRQLDTARALGNPLYFDEATIRRDAIRAFERGFHRGSVARHFVVGLTAPDLRERLATLRLPVQVIHGRADKVVPLALAQETAAAIAGARLEILADMAHEAPPQLWDRWINLFAENAARAAVGAGAAGRQRIAKT